MLGLNKNFPLALVHAGPASLGLNIDKLPTMQGTVQLQLFLVHLNKSNRTSFNIEISCNYLKLEIAMEKFPLAVPHITKSEHVPMTWITSICHFLHRTNRWVETHAQQIVRRQQNNDRFIMQQAVNSNFNLKLVQQCRLWFQVVTLVDVCDLMGQQVEKLAFRKKGRKSNL